jgi:hypothetical protein
MVDEVNDETPSAGTAITSNKILMYKIEFLVQEPDNFIE